MNMVAPVGTCVDREAEMRAYLQSPHLRILAKEHCWAIYHYLRLLMSRGSPQRVLMDRCLQLLRVNRRSAFQNSCVP